MPKFLIERTIPGAGDMSTEQLRGLAAQSNGVLHDLQRHGTPIQWIQSYVTDDALSCVYVAPNAEAVREHARIGGFPCDQVRQVETVIDATTGE